MRISNNSFWLLSIAVSLMLAGCSSLDAQRLSEPRAGANCSREADAIISISGSTLTICGVINGRLIGRLPESFDDITEISMTSAGGDGFAAASLAIILNEHAMPVRFDGLCASACLDLFILADSVRRASLHQKLMPSPRRPGFPACSRLHSPDDRRR